MPILMIGTYPIQFGCLGKVEPLDGRATEEVLEHCSDLIEQGQPQYVQLYAALAARFAHHGKTPNTLASISIVPSDGAPAQVAPPNELVNLLATVYSRFPATQPSAFRRMAMSEQFADDSRMCDGPLTIGRSEFNLGIEFGWFALNHVGLECAAATP